MCRLRRSSPTRCPGNCTGSPTSGYRLLEHAYAEIIQGLPEEIKGVVPLWDQIYLEQFHSRYVDSLDLSAWDTILGLQRPDGPTGRVRGKRNY